jgi:hypothetical protein
MLLIVAILASLSVIALSELRLRPRLKAMIVQCNELTTSLAWTRDTLATSEKNLKERTFELATTQQMLASKEEQRSVAVAERNSAVESAARFQKLQAEAEAARQRAEIDLAQWRVLGLTPQQVIWLRDQHQSLTNDVTALSARLLDSTREAKYWSNLVAAVFPIDDPPMPLELRGRVAAVDPKWGFVVLDVGERQQVKPRGILLVGRAGRCVATLRVLRVEPEHAIAEIIPGSSSADVIEGDEVLPRAPTLLGAKSPRP